MQKFFINIITIFTLVVVSFFILSFTASPTKVSPFQNDINNVILYYQDTTKLLDINDILSIPKDYFLENQKGTNLDKQGVYWGYLTLTNETNKSLNKIITLGKKRHSDIADIFIFGNRRMLKHAKSGHFVKASKKEIKEELGSKFSIKLEPNQKYEIYFRIKNISGYKPAFKLKIEDSEVFYSNISKRNLIFGIIQGILLIMLFYNLLIFVFNRDLVYIFYSLYVFGMILNIATERGLFLEYIIPEHPKLNPYVFIIATGIALSAYFQFLRLFLNTKKEIKKWDKILKNVILINIIATVLLIINLLIGFNIPIAINGSNIINFAFLIIGIFFITYLLKHRSTLAFFFIIGTVFLVVGTVMNLFFLMSGLDPGFDAYHLMNAGIVGQILFFSLGLGFKINQMEKAKIIVQKELIIQLKKNEELKDKVNKELEEKIRERTKEIQEKNDKLNIYTSELVEKNDLLLERNEEINQQKEEIQSIVEMLKDTNDKIVAQSNEIEESNKSLTDSINSAKRIQNAMLPSELAFRKAVNQHFVIYLPRDIVSGDFYWLRKIGKFVVVIAADSTGHGVPGAFVSMMGMAFLNDIVGKSGITKANQVLDELREQVKTSLNQVGSAYVREGMDLALCAFDTETNELQYAGANNPLYIIRNNSKSDNPEFINIKADRQPIGIFRKEKPFTNHQIQLQEGDVVYIFSDGIVDQFGGKYNEKYKSKRFKEHLLSIQDKPLAVQGKLIQQAFYEWKADCKQLDDVLVIGIQFF